MSTGKVLALSAGLAGALALGIWIGPHITGPRDAAATSADGSAQMTNPEGAPAAASVPAPREIATAEPALPAIPASSPDLQKRLKPVLMEGADLKIASKGFRDGEQFATVAHASRNTGVNFMLLKDRVVSQRKSLAAALRELKPEVNAVKEANRARVMARADIASLAL
jgi:hypothetical protein